MSYSPVSVLANYDTVIWSTGDRAFANLTSTNVITLTNYLNSGGHLLYADGNDLYQETAAAAFITNFLDDDALQLLVGVSPTTV